MKAYPMSREEFESFKRQEKHAKVSTLPNTYELYLEEFEEMVKDDEL